MENSWVFYVYTVRAGGARRVPRDLLMSFSSDTAEMKKRVSGRMNCFGYRICRCRYNRHGILWVSAALFELSKGVHCLTWRLMISS